MLLSSNTHHVIANLTSLILLSSVSVEKFQTQGVKVESGEGGLPKVVLSISDGRCAISDFILPAAA